MVSRMRCPTNERMHFLLFTWLYSNKVLCKVSHASNDVNYSLMTPINFQLDRNRWVFHTIIVMWSFLSISLLQLRILVSDCLYIVLNKDSNYLVQRLTLQALLIANLNIKVWLHLPWYTIYKDISSELSKYFRVLSDIGLTEF